MAAWTAHLAPKGRLLSGWAGLGRFWLAILIVLGVGAGVLQALGPREPTIQAAALQSEPKPAEHAEATVAAKPVEPPAARPATADKASFQPLPPGRGVPGPVTDPDPGLMEPDPEAPKAFLPRISADGRTPMHEYAAGFDSSNRRPRIGILVAGIGLSEADSATAIHQLPGAVTLAISPYAVNIDHLLAEARIAEHEYLLSIPMEPQGFPINDPDDRRALMTSLPPSENLARLHWVLSRIAGYAGVTNALGQIRGERLSGMHDQFTAVLEDAGARGLLFVDARPSQPIAQFAWNRSIDMVVDEDPVGAAALDGRLEALAKLARDKGSALGLVMVPRPVTLDRLIAWTNTLADKGLVLAPVSALVVPPAKSDEEPEK